MIIGTCRDSAEAALVRAVLSAHGIPFHISGEGHAAMVGVGAAAIAQVIFVPRELAEEARALLDEMRQGGAAALAEDEIPADDTAERLEELTEDGALVTSTDDTLARLGTRKRLVLAVLVGLFIGHGAAHFSTRAWGRGALLLAIQIVGWRVLVAGNLAGGAAIVLTTMAMDVVGAALRIVSTESPLPTARVRRR